MSHRVSDHEEVARHIIKGRNTALVPQNADCLIGEIAEALQNAFDMGYRAAGGTVGVLGERLTPPRSDTGETK